MTMSMMNLTRRNWTLRLSVVLNVCVLLYVSLQFGSSGPWVDETTNNWAQAPLAEALKAADPALNGSLANRSGSRTILTKDVGAATTRETKTEATGETTKDAKLKTTEKASKSASPTTTNQELAQMSARDEGIELQEAIPCEDRNMEPRTAQRGDYWVLYNYVPMSASVRCWESLTYTTHADYTFMDNLEPLLERWRAPVSIAMHAPGSDFAPTLRTIKYLRSCGSPLVSQLTTFHIYFSSKHVPKEVPFSEKVVADSYNCSLGPPWVNVTVAKMYKTEKKLLYPVNVGRNIAREMAPTHYVLPSDIELYPSPDLPPKFLEMIRRRDQQALHRPNPKVFVLSIFEVDEKSLPPNNKTALREMLKNGTAIPFHKKLCSACHNVPRSKEWQESPETEGLHVFHVGKRSGAFVHWEPIYIGTHKDPMYDERLSWEGKSDKMTQGYSLCVLDYDFLILDNAFLVHRPGIKIYKSSPYRDTLTGKQSMLIKKIIFPELKVIYGSRKGCAV